MVDIDVLHEILDDAAQKFIDSATQERDRAIEAGDLPMIKLYHGRKIGLEMAFTRVMAELNKHRED